LPIPENIIFPDGPFDVVITASVYTYLETLEICKRYIEETTRALKPNGNFFSTWFRSPPHELSSHSTKTVLREADIMNLLKDYHIDSTKGGWPEDYHDQWYIYGELKNSSILY
jgi:ubiquinone/menaquinone biosynthesis C-methylase UbiE